MPNTGKPSPSCALCEKRQVKVRNSGRSHCVHTLIDNYITGLADCALQYDLTRPACLRCTKFGAPCPGYRRQLDPDPHSLHFRYYDGSGAYTSLFLAVSLGPENSRLELWADPSYSTMLGQSSFFNIFEMNPSVSSQYSHTSPPSILLLNAKRQFPRKQGILSRPSVRFKRE